MQWNLTSILVIIVVLFFGYGIGLLEMHLRRQKKINELDNALKREQAKSALVPAPPPPAFPVPSTSDLRLWTNENGIFKLELNNEPVNTPATTTPEQRRRLITLLTRLRPWVESTPAAATASEVPPRATVAEVPPVTKVTPGADQQKSAPVLKSIVEQIDDVLQVNLLVSQFKDRDIRLTEEPGGVVIIKDGLNKYEGIDAVPEPEIQTLIRQAVSEWEKMTR